MAETRTTGTVDKTAAKSMKTKRAPRGKSFASRNTKVIGGVGLITIALMIWAAFNAGKLPLIGGGTPYTMMFKDASGLRPEDEVRIAGVKVGKVTKVGLDGDQVKVEMRIKKAFVGNESVAVIKIKTLLGRKYLELDSKGAEKQDPKRTIPLARTITPYDVYPAFSDLTRTVAQIDTKALGQSFHTLAETFKDTPDEVGKTLQGLSRLSTNIANRDTALRTLLARANQVTGVLANRDEELTKLLSDGNLLLEELNARREAIRTLFLNTSALSLQISGLVHDNEQTLKPALDELKRVLDMLQRNADSIDRGIALLAPFLRVFANTLGNGRWFDTYIQNLTGGGLVGIATGGLLQ